MPNIQVRSKPGLASVGHRQKLSWEIEEEDWNNAVSDGYTLILILKDEIPGTVRNSTNLPDGDNYRGPYPGGHIEIDEDGVRFYTEWPRDVKVDDVNLEAAFRFRTNDGQVSVNLENWNMIDDGKKLVYQYTFVSINTQLLFDETRSFVLEADLVVEVNLSKKKKCVVGISDEFAIAVKSIFNDEKNSDVVVVAEDQTFKCHKNILCARSEVFKNTLAHNTLESESNTIVMKEIPAKTVEDMLKYLYSGDTPKDPERLSIDLLHLAEMHQLHPLKEVCIKNMMKGLDVSSCISTLLLVDRYMPHDGYLREKVISFIECKAKEVVELEDWNQLVNTHPIIVTELTRAFARGVGEHRCQMCILDYP